jgi:hypothetical protein
VQFLGGEMAVALGEEQRAKRNALPRRPQARVAHALIDRCPSDLRSSNPCSPFGRSG